MNKQLEKYNPDVGKKYETIQKERDTMSYTFSNKVYKGITNNFPNQINGPDDLKIKSDEPDYNLIKIRMETSILEREKEKAEQERILKELQEKKLEKKLVINQPNSTSNNTQESHQDMKVSHQKFSIEKNDNLIKEKLVINDVLDFINNLS
jgi:hypothetical protein